MYKTKILIDTKCPYCKTINHSLETYHLVNTTEYVFIGDVVLHIHRKLKNQHSFLKSIGYCWKCNRTYRVEIAVDNGKLTNIVIIKKNRR